MIFFQNGFFFSLLKIRLFFRKLKIAFDSKFFYNIKHKNLMKIYSTLIENMLLF
jgi:hypothetical protein